MSTVQNAVTAEAGNSSATIRARVGDSAIDKVTRLFSAGLADIFTETLQNSRFGTPELGSIGLLELIEYRGPFGLGIERDIHFTAAFPLSIYAEAARASGHIVESRPELEAAARILAVTPAMKLTGHDGREG